MIRVLINAYACSPNMGSEPGMAWNWIINLAQYCQLHVITEGEFKGQIEEAMEKLPVAQNIRFYYNPLSPNIREMCWNQGDWRFYYYYRKWQKRTLSIAKRIIEEESIDIVHQLNMIGFREPGFLWQLNGQPFIWGPIDAKERFPLNYLNGTDFRTAMTIRLKNNFNYLQLKISGRVKQAVAQASYVVAASTDSQVTIEKYYGKKPILINETGCYVKEKSEFVDKTTKETFDILWVGKFDFRKQLGLAIQIIGALKNPRVKFHIIGDDQNMEGARYKKVAEKLNVEDVCIWHGKVPHERVQEIMRSCDLFLFTSVAEGTPHVVLESIGNNLPVVCFDTCGQGDVVNENIGIKVPLSHPSQSVNDFVEKISYLITNRRKLTELSENCFLRQHELSWDKKSKQMLSLYQKAIAKN
ncbi:glycosyltransferase [uncultured Sunxiuqinia sp.]|uniref:glycosyltransferase family 4 protein n=1 Tax=uncultured Sunxiuqinia sp. TaxID=1573825 RepID=UPI00262D2CFF|nr:glycosyltransferase [uncultured Sunxiuqinia sp.]